MLWGGGLDLWICISIIFISVLPAAHTAPVEDWPEDSQLAFPEEGCYYQYKHYDEGEQIITNEPCLNCTCHNQMLMCFLRVCPFIKPVGKDCIVEKSESQCCPTITCPPGKLVPRYLVPQVSLSHDILSPK
ncbi:uncharacterized protein LOC111705720 [Eurytemora carolleeae]|uniref:uncharacterized protein LOC111705720 n=1 Tax=Eurytemora carolleeae TaxID=1294199 RepID=UPI000C791F36|nr:uncharacterized protein LOC111705720 [Eurytemora carolleeae]XP_023334134.1 uncharacterized protein LOC111705720 [Eurytemora carolleeae]|eukprot:XP_023334133.1 uncharacterized protein LOC111705720 [Eurytemora affinis]